MSLYCLNTLFPETNSSWLLSESIKDLEIETSMLFNLVFANNTVFSYFFLFFLIIDLYYIIAVVIAQIFNPTTELEISKGIPNNKGKAEIETCQW